ncbi:hypothetical protein G7B40_039315 [Aetokthonos hydrillicola Thurmond2011]|jgi:hypothetical protein|uniref:Uncharacterized protein n=1 Tax=Aetokthonos hydrillicola Thurmond2011 TaxID=2712845 RepID=A0AAP5MDG5_9CYAN|nr:hypothetical protein [Aetokthonos hydrillicola]MBO3463461.1 hypothetical protein [Aetokthonos hydrillicola CCALA 1050]MBW4591161.1 hypothetical protein [Aetokthonos hydrillicola CCALA 1050]MDR9900542.1 hypothetical protein [Aetokthonos hydrillicola Thurmond2011]
MNVQLVNSLVEVVLNLSPEDQKLFQSSLQTRQIAANRENQPQDQITALRTSSESASILTQALAEHQSRKNGSEN